jgi:hypothetical protein
MMSGRNPMISLSIDGPFRAGAILAGGVVAVLVNIPDIRYGPLLASSQNRVRASRVSCG